MSLLMAPAEHYASIAHLQRYVRSVKGEFSLGIARGQRKRIAKCQRAGYSCHAVPMDCTLHALIVANRARKGRRYAMSFTDWATLAATARAQCFAVYRSEDALLAAAALCTLPKRSILYVAAWGDAPGQEQFSPVTLLAQGIYEWSAARGIELIDLGIADEAPLARFKVSLGFAPCSNS